MSKNGIIRMAKYVEQELRKAYKNTGTDDIAGTLEKLFFCLSKEVDPRISEASSVESHQYYFQIMAKYYQEFEANSPYVLKACKIIWSYTGYTMVSALLFHDFLLAKMQNESPESQPEYEEMGREDLVKHLGLLVVGCERIFRYDLSKHTRIYKPIFDKLVKVMLSDSTNYLAFLEAIPSFIHVIGQFFLYYNLPCTLHELIEGISYSINEVKFKPKAQLLSQTLNPENNIEKTKETSSNIQEILPELSFNQLYLKIADVLTINAINTLRDIKFIETITEYIEMFRIYQGIQISIKTKNRIQICLNMLTHPGAPYFAPREVYRAAARMFDLLFPTGKVVRTVVRYFFRMLHPYYWPKVVLNFFKLIFVTILFNFVVYHGLPRTYYFLMREKKSKLFRIKVVLGVFLYFWIDIFGWLLWVKYTPPENANSCQQLF